MYTVVTVVLGFNDLYLRAVYIIEWNHFFSRCPEQDEEMTVDNEDGSPSYNEKNILVSYNINETTVEL